jgi:hypothetical protein
MAHAAAGAMADEKPESGVEPSGGLVLYRILTG